MRLRAAYLVALCFAAGGCDSTPPKATPVGGPAIQQKREEVFKVAVLGDGTIQVDGRPYTLEELEEFYKQHQHLNDAIWLYREGGATNAHPNAKQVVDLTGKYGLRIANFSQKADFSDTFQLPK